MTIQDFANRYRCRISKRYQTVGHRYQRLNENKRYHIDIDIRKMKPFNPKSVEDCNNCLTFSCDTSLGAKEKAYNYLVENGHFAPSLVA